MGLDAMILVFWMLNFKLYPLGFAPEAALEDFSVPHWGKGAEVVQLLGSQGFWQHQVLRGVGG